MRAGAGAPKVESDMLGEIRMFTGTMWHSWLMDALRRLGVPFMAEVNLNPWLPKGWGGTADLVVWNPELKGFVLADLKTTKGEGIRFIRQGGPKTEHVHQTSAYWHALKAMGIPLVKKIGVYYLPMNPTKEPVAPLLADFDPIPAKKLHAGMDERWGRVSEYVESLNFDPYMDGGPYRQEPEAYPSWLTPALAPVQPRQQRVFFDRKTATYELRLMPHWTAAYCPFPAELCDCSAQGQTKVGMFSEGDYHPRPGFEEITPEVFPG
jgi:hypothetical protein